MAIAQATQSRMLVAAAGVSTGLLATKLVTEQVTYGISTLAAYVNFDYPHLSSNQTAALNLNQKFDAAYTAGINSIKTQLSDMQSIARSTASQQYTYFKHSNELSKTIAEDIKRLQHTSAHPELFAKALLQKDLALEENILKTHKAKTDLEIMKMNLKAVSDFAKKSQSHTLTDKLQSTIQNNKDIINQIITEAKYGLAFAADRITLDPILAALGLRPRTGKSDSCSVLEGEMTYLGNKIANLKKELTRLTSDTHFAKYSNRILKHESQLKSIDTELATLYTQQKEEYKQLSEITKVVSEESYVKWEVLEPQIQRTNQELLYTAVKRAFVWTEMENTKFELAGEQALNDINIYHQKFLIHTAELLYNTFEAKSRQIQGLPKIPIDDSAYDNASKITLEEYQAKYGNREVKDLLTLPITHTESKNTAEDLKTSQSMSDNQKVSDPAAESDIATESKQATEIAAVSKDILESPIIKERVNSLVLAQKTQALSSTKPLEISDTKELAGTLDSISTTNSDKEAPVSTEEIFEGKLEVYKRGEVSLSSTYGLPKTNDPEKDQLLASALKSFNDMQANRLKSFGDLSETIAGDIEGAGNSARIEGLYNEDISQVETYGSLSNSDHQEMKGAASILKKAMGSSTMDDKFALDGKQPSSMIEGPTASSTALDTNTSPASKVKNAQSKPVNERGVELHN